MRLAIRADVVWQVGTAEAILTRPSLIGSPVHNPSDGKSGSDPGHLLPCYTRQIDSIS